MTLTQTAASPLYPADVSPEPPRAADQPGRPPGAERPGLLPGAGQPGRPRAADEPEAPPAVVLRAFGVHGARRLAGGQGAAWRAGDLVLKPDAGPVWEWLAPMLLDLSLDGVRIAKPVATRDGSWTHSGWSATTFIDGVEPTKSTLSTWVEIVEAGRAFHSAMRSVPRPNCLDKRTDPWAAADRAAWGEQTLRYLPEFAETVRRVIPALSHLGPAQLVHGDLTGNVLISPGMAPAIIDISPYWRPPAYAEGIVVADALCWHDAFPGLLDVVGVPLAAVARALLFRMGATSERVRAAVPGLDVQDEAQRYNRAATALGL